MPIDPNKPLLKLNVGPLQNKPTGKPRHPPKPEQFSYDHQRAVFGTKFDRLASILSRDQNGIELKSDPSALAPERLLVFEVRGSVESFIYAIKKVPGLEYIDQEELEGDEEDDHPVLYLLVPDAIALSNIISIWQRWNKGEQLGKGFAPWREVFATLRDIRPWGPKDRVHPYEKELIASEIASMGDEERVRLEIELIFRELDDKASETEGDVRHAITLAGGDVISRCRIVEIGYHAILVELPVFSVRDILKMSPESIAGLDPVMHIRPQSMATTVEVNEAEVSTTPLDFAAAVRTPILALLDGVPVSEHPILAGGLDVNDQFELEPLTQVVERKHGTAMASLIMHGDRNKLENKLDRLIHVVPVLGKQDEFPGDRLIVDMIYQAIIMMRDSDKPSAPDIVIVNLSLGNARKPFYGHMSAWARLIDRLAYRLGIIFIISAGNHEQVFNVPGFVNFTDYEDAPDDTRARETLVAINQLIAERRLLAPSESVNGVTIGAANIDAVSAADRLSGRTSIDPYPNYVMSNPSSALGPGFANSVKPDILMPGAREHVSLVTTGGTTLSIRSRNGVRAYGLKVAAPPRDGIGNLEGFSCGTSAAAALASRTCHQIHDALESAYQDVFSSLSHIQRATLLKALLVHTASWPRETAELIKQTLGPYDSSQHVRQKDNIRRFLGYGIVDSEIAVTCAADRATFWASGILPKEQAVQIRVPIPACVNGLVNHHELYATLAWFTPTLPGRQRYRTVRLKLVAPDDLDSLRVNVVREQPDKNQSDRGTVFSRRWAGIKAPVVSDDHYVVFTVQRERDQGAVIDEPVPFGFAATFTMPGVEQIYEEVRIRLGIPLRTKI